MFVVIPGELIALLTFPGVVLHEISHRFFCDIQNIDVYAINYFQPFSKKAGHVIYRPTNNFFHSFFIAIGPLIINSLVCILLTFPAGCNAYLDTDFVDYSSSFVSLAYLIMQWIGYSIGFHAMPSNKDMSGLKTMVHSWWARTILGNFTGIIGLFNITLIGPLLRILFAYGLSMVLPRLFLG